MTGQKNPQTSALPELRRSIPPAPVHPLAALATIVLDNLFLLPELAGPQMWLVTVPLIGGIGLLATTMVQHYLAKDSWGEAVAKGLVMGIVAGVPVSVTGTAVGGILLAWAGLHEWVKLPAPAGKPEQVSSKDDVIDGEARDVE
jgi:hypothetical protein